jgi:putative SOS response-associated peptidase YedK
MKSKDPFAFAGLWDQWTDKKTGDNILSSTIITTDPNILLTQIHNRMPVILSKGHIKLWLSVGPVPETALMECLRPYPDEEMEAYEVPNLVNNPLNYVSKLIMPLFTS